MDVISLAVGFLIGTATGAAGQYFGAKYTDKRRATDQRKEAHQEWLDLEARFPAIIAEMRQDASDPDMVSARHLFVKTRGSVLNAAGPHFEYHTDVYPDLEAAIAQLERLGFIEDVTRGNCPKYRMTEEFFDQLRRT